MYSKAEKKQMKLDFWTSLENKLTEKGKAKGRNIVWMSYPTKVKDLYFRTEISNGSAKLCIDMQFLDDGVREVFFEQFQEFELKLNQAFKSSAIYVKDYEHSNGKIISRIYTEIQNVHLLNKNDWDKMQDFLIYNFLKLDDFWLEFSEVFHNLK
jgi:hypothetical protein